MWRTGGLALLYIVLPPLVYFFTPRNVRWPAALITMSLMSVTGALLYTRELGSPSFEAVFVAAVAAVLGVPFWMGPILLWRDITEPPPAAREPKRADRAARHSSTSI